MLADSLIDSIIHSGPWVPLAIALALFAWVFARIRKRQAGAQKFGGNSKPTSSGGAKSDGVTARGTPRESNSISAGELRTVASELNALLVELHETAQRLAAQMDNRATRLDALLAEADEKIKRLEAIQGAGKATGGDQGTREVPTPTNAAAVEDPQYRRIYDLADRGHSPREIAAQLGTPSGEVELILNLRARPTHE